MNQPKKHGKADQVVIGALALVICAHFVTRVLIGLGPWISKDDAQRTLINSIFGLWDANPWFDLLPIVLFMVVPGVKWLWSRKDYSALMVAASKGDADRVKALIASGADVNARDKSTHPMNPSG